MTVRELMKALAAFDPDLPVVIPSRVHEDFCEFEQMFADVLARSPRHSGLELCDPGDAGCRTVLRFFETGDYDDRDGRGAPASV